MPAQTETTETSNNLETQETIPLNDRKIPTVFKSHLNKLTQIDFETSDEFSLVEEIKNIKLNNTDLNYVLLELLLKYLPIISEIDL